MTENQSYISLIDSFLKSHVSITDFERDYLDLFHNTANDLGKDVYEIIEPLFYAVSDFTQDETLLEQGDFYIDETQLREAAAKTLEQLRAVKN